MTADRDARVRVTEAAHDDISRRSWRLVEKAQESARAAEAKLATLSTPPAPAQDWQPIETAPADTWVQVAVPGEEIPVAAIRDNGRWIGVDGERISRQQPTHWMTLPALPNQETAA